MIRIDLRWLITPAMPFVLLLLGRGLFFVAGVAWSEPETALGVSIFFGIVAGFAITVALLVEEIEIGHITIGRKTDK